jgi:transposase
LPVLNPWPLPNSIVIIDNAKIHMYNEFIDMIHSKGALMFFLPPYSPQLNPIEVGFSLVKAWIQRNCNLAFSHNPKECIYLAFKSCAEKQGIALNLFGHCGYGIQLKDEMFI